MSFTSEIKQVLFCSKKWVRNKVCVIGLCRCAWGTKLNSLGLILPSGVNSGGRHSFGAVRFVSRSTVSLFLYAVVMGVGGNVVAEGQLRKMQSAGNVGLFEKHFYPIMAKMMATDAEWWF